MLDNFEKNVGADRMKVPKERGLDFYQVLTLASIVEREAVLDEERPLIAGVYQNRIDGLPGIKNKILNADPTVIWANDTVELDKLAFDQWQKYAFWAPPKVPMKEVQVPDELAGYQTYIEPGSDPRADRDADAAVDRCRARARHRRTSTCTSWRSRTAAAKHAFAKTAKEFHEAPQGVRLPVTARLAGPSGLRRAADRRAARRLGAADRAARPARLARLRARFAAAGVDAYFGVRPEHTRYLTGVVLGDGEEKVAGQSGQFLVGGDEVVVLADSRYTIQARARRPTPGSFEAYHDLPRRWPELVASVGARRVAVEAGFVSHATWERLAAAAPDVELVPVEGWVEADRAVKEPAEVERDRRGVRRRGPGARGAAARDPAPGSPRPSSRSGSSG